MIRKKAESHFHALDLDDPEVSVVLADDETTRSLNADWRDRDETTDVLSFPLYEGEELPEHVPVLGDIVINLDYAERLVDTEEHGERVARELGVPVEELEWDLADEVHFLFIHGLLHLTGRDHADPEEARDMKEAERRLWRAAERPDGSG